MTYLCGQLSRDGAVVARRAHNPKVIGSSPIPATNKTKSRLTVGLFFATIFTNNTNVTVRPRGFGAIPATKKQSLA